MYQFIARGIGRNWTIISCGCFLLQVATQRSSQQNPTCCTRKVVCNHALDEPGHETDGLSHAPIHELSRIRCKYRYLHMSLPPNEARRGGGVFLSSRSPE